MKANSKFYYIFFITVFSFSLNIAKATSWFVNDNSLTGDVFTTAVGNDANPGTSAQPFATLTFAMTIYAEGDTIYVDAGTYNEDDITIPNNLTLRGAKYGIPAGPLNVPVNRGTGESILTFGIFYGPALLKLKMVLSTTSH